MSDPKIPAAVDGMEFYSGDVRCPCGKTHTLYWNGGELDQRSCGCGRTLRTEHHKVVLRVIGPCNSASEQH